MRAPHLIDTCRKLISPTHLLKILKKNKCIHNCKNCLHPDLCVRFTDADKAFYRYTNGCVHRDGEADLSQGQEDWNQVGKSVEGVELRELRQGKNTVSQKNTACVRDKQQAEKVSENWLQLKFPLLQNCKSEQVTQKKGIKYGLSMISIKIPKTPGKPTQGIRTPSSPNLH